MTIYLFCDGRLLLWDIPYCDTFSSGTHELSATSSDYADHQAEKDRLPRYQSPSDRFIVELVTADTSGILEFRTISLFTSIKAEMVSRKCDPRESEWLFQYISPPPLSFDTTSFPFCLLELRGAKTLFIKVIMHIWWSKVILFWTTIFSNPRSKYWGLFCI